MRAFAVAIVLLAASCATVNRPDGELLKPAVEVFHDRIRWKDFRGAAELVVPERRMSFLRGRMRAGDDENLTITGFELEEAKLTPDATTAEVLSTISWYRLPSAVQQTRVVTSVFAWREGKWLLESQDAGPFEELAPTPRP